MFLPLECFSFLFPLAFFPFVSLPVVPSSSFLSCSPFWSLPLVWPIVLYVLVLCLALLVLFLWPNVPPWQRQVQHLGFLVPSWRPFDFRRRFVCPGAQLMIVEPDQRSLNPPGQSDLRVVEGKQRRRNALCHRFEYLLGCLATPK